MPFSGWNVVSMPTDPAPKSIEPAYNSAVGSVNNPFNKKQQIQDWQSSFTEIKVTIPPMLPDTGAFWKAFLVACNGIANVFMLPPAVSALLPPSIGPSGYWRLKSNMSGWSVNDGLIHGLEFELREALPVADVTLGPIPPGGGGGGTPPTNPVPIDPVQMAGSLNGTPGDYYRNYGPISYGGWMWAFTLTEDEFSGSNDSKLGIYKSQDGSTWLRQDLSNAPNEGTPSYPYWDGSSPTVKILVVAKESSSPFTETAASFVNFDMSSGQFSSPYGTIDLRVVPSGATAGDPTIHIMHPYVFQMSNGTMRVVYQYWYQDTGIDHGSGSFPGGSQSQLYYQDYASGAWGTRQVFPSQTVAWSNHYFLNSATQDGDVIHAVYMPIDGLGGGPPVWNDAFYVQIKADGTFTTPQSLAPVLSPDGTTYFALNTGVISGNSILIPVISYGTTASTVGALIGTSKSNPTFSYVAIPGADGSNADGAQMYHMASSDALAYWQYNPATSSNSQIYISTSTDGGTTWSTATLRLDLAATPVPAVTGQDTVDINSISLGTYLDGSLGLLFTSWCAYYVPPAP